MLEPTVVGTKVPLLPPPQVPVDKVFVASSASLIKGQILTGTSSGVVVGVSTTTGVSLTGVIVITTVAVSQVGIGTVLSQTT